MNLNRCAGVNVTMLTIIDFSVPASHTQSREFERRERDASPFITSIAGGRSSGDDCRSPARMPMTWRRTLERRDAGDREEWLQPSKR